MVASLRLIECTLLCPLARHQSLCFILIQLWKTKQRHDMTKNVDWDAKHQHTSNLGENLIKEMRIRILKYFNKNKATGNRQQPFWRSSELLFIGQNHYSFDQSMYIEHCCKNQVINEKWALHGTSIFDKNVFMVKVITWSKISMPYWKGIYQNKVFSMRKLLNTVIWMKQELSDLTHYPYLAFVYI